MYIASTSSFFSLMSVGLPWHIFYPWCIEVDTDKEQITVSKRNWYLVGKDSKTIMFKYIRSITIDQHLFGADIIIKVVGGVSEAKCLSKADCNKIKLVLIQFNERKRGKQIVIS